MKILIFADLHLHNHYRLIVNSETALDNLVYFKEYAIKNNIDTIICAGDFFHTKAKAYAPHVIQARLRLKDWYKSGLTHYMIVGNHDMSNQTNSMNSIIFAFNEYAKIIPDYFFFDVEDTRIHLMSYTNKLFPHFILSEEKRNVLIAHLDIIGFTLSNGYHSTLGFKKSDLKEFDLVITGHYHKHQKRDNIVYIGSTHQTSFSDCGQDRGFIVFDTDTLEYEFIKNKRAPEYKILSIKKYEDINSCDIYNKFLRIKLLSHRISIIKLKELLFEKGALSVDIIPPENAKEIGKYCDKALSDIPSEIAAAYINSLNNLPYNKQKLLTFFNKIEEITNQVVEFEFGE